MKIHLHYSQANSTALSIKIQKKRDIKYMKINILLENTSRVKRAFLSYIREAGACLNKCMKLSLRSVILSVVLLSNKADGS